MAMGDAATDKRQMLARFETLLIQKVKQSEIPFLGLHDSLFTSNMSDYVGQVAAEQRSVDVYIRYLHLCPTLFSINLTRQVMHNFGADGHFAVWPSIAEMIGVRDLSSQEREQLWKAFRQSCVMLGLEVSPRISGAHYMVNEFLRHAGVPLPHIDQLVDRMLTFAAKVGIPDENDPTSVQAWREALLERLTFPFPVTTRNAVDLDEDGYYVRLFSRLFLEQPNQADVTSELERRMLQSILQRGRTAQRRRTVEIPQLVLRDSIIGIQIPAGELREWTVDADGRSWTYSGAYEARFVPLQEPLARQATVSETGSDLCRTFSLWPQGENNELLIFEGATGRFLASARLGLPEITVSPGEHTLLLRFMPSNWAEEIPCVSEEPTLYLSRILLRPGACLRITRGPASINVRAEARPALAWVGEPFVTNEGLEVYSSSSLSAVVTIPEEMRIEAGYALHVYPETLGKPSQERVALDRDGVLRSRSKILLEERAGARALGEYFWNLAVTGKDALSRVPQRSSGTGYISSMREARRLSAPLCLKI